MDGLRCKGWSTYQTDLIHGGIIVRVSDRSDGKGHCLGKGLVQPWNNTDSLVLTTSCAAAPWRPPPLSRPLLNIRVASMPFSFQKIVRLSVWN